LSFRESCEAARTLSWAFAAAALLGVACPSNAFGQDVVSPDRPPRGLFGGRPARTTGQTLELTWSTFSGYDDNVRAETPAAADPSFLVKGTYGTGGAGLAYAARGERSAFGASLSSNGHYYPDLHELNGVEASGNLTFNTTLGRRGQLQGSQNFSYEPFYGVNFLNSASPSSVPVVAQPQDGRGTDTALKGLQAYDSNGQITLKEGLSVRSALQFAYSYRHTVFGSGDEHFNWQLANVTFSRNMTRYAALRAGYGYGVAQDTLGAGVPTVVNHNIDLGVDYNRPLSFSRRTKIALSSGSTAVVERGSTTYFVIGDAKITREMSRTWNGSFGYHRGIQHLPGFSDVFVSDTAQLQFGGLVGRRVDASMGGGYSIGHVGVQDRGSRGYSSLTATGVVRIAISSVLAFTTQYTYYRYAFDDGVEVPLGLPSAFNRQALLFGLSGWVPLVR